jgi:predicted component of viral defense system (DUF524 family)
MQLIKKVKTNAGNVPEGNTEWKEVRAPKLSKCLSLGGKIHFFSLCLFSNFYTTNIYYLYNQQPKFENEIQKSVDSSILCRKRSTEFGLLDTCFSHSVCPSAFFELKNQRKSSSPLEMWLEQAFCSYCFLKYSCNFWLSLLLTPTNLSGNEWW